MTAFLPPQIYLQILDQNGNPLAGGTFSTYLAGSDTPIATFTDKSMTVENLETIVIPATGIIRYWLNPNLAYKIVIRRPSGAIYYAIDNVTSNAGEGVGVVKVSESDTTNGFLGDKLEGGTNITLTTVTDVDGAEKIVISCSGFALNDLQGAYDDGDGTISLDEDKPFVVRGNEEDDRLTNLFELRKYDNLTNYSVQPFSTKQQNLVTNSYFYRDLGADATETKMVLSRGGRYFTDWSNTVDDGAIFLYHKLNDIYWGFQGGKVDGSDNIGAFRIEGAPNGATFELSQKKTSVGSLMYKFVGENQVSETNRASTGGSYRYTYLNNDYWNDSLLSLPNDVQKIESLQGVGQTYSNDIRVGLNYQYQTSHSTSGFNQVLQHDGVMRLSTSLQVGNSQYNLNLTPTTYGQIRNYEFFGNEYATLDLVSQTTSKVMLSAVKNVTSDIIAESSTVRAKMTASDLGVAGAFTVFNKGTLVDDVNVTNETISYLKTGLRTKAHIYSERVVHGWSSTIFLQWEEGNFHEVTLAGTTSFSLVNGPNQYGASYGVLINNPSAHAVNWGGNVLWAGGVEPDLAVAGVHMVTFYHTVIGGTDVYLALGATSFA